MIYDARDCARLRFGVLLTSAVAWVAMVAVPGGSCHCRTYSSGAALGQLLASQSFGSLAYGWLLMLVAMMGPMTLPALYRIRIGSFVSRRWRSSALFVTSYVLVWMVAGALLTVAELVAKWRAPGSYGPAAIVGLVGLVWQMSPFKQRCLNRCHAHPPLAAFGLAADRDAFLMGLGHGRWCVGSCWAIMLFPMLLPEWHLTAMAAATLSMVCERLEPPTTPAWRLRGLPTATRWLRMQLFGPRTSPPPYAPAPR